MSIPRRLPPLCEWRSSPRCAGQRVGPGFGAAAAIVVMWTRPGLILALGCLLSLWAAGRSVRRAATRRRAAESMSRELPGVLSLLGLAVAAGHGPRDAIRVAGSSSDGTAARFFSSVGERLRGGADIHTALWFDRRDVDSDLARVLSVLERADSDGAALAPNLEQLAGDLHRVRLASLEQASRRASVAILFPLVLCILPAFIALALLPLLFSVLSNLSV